jgi:pSer/pThr/pTyr-binding forkhead associated (FHA) protein
MLRHVIARPDGTPWPVLKPLCRQLSRSIRVGRQVCVIGSHSRVHLPLHSSMVSRSHALVVMDHGETYVRDLASSNGVYLNGGLVRETKLRHGDVLGIGPFAFRWNSLVQPPPRNHPLGPVPENAGGTFEVLGDDRQQPMRGRTLLIGQRAGCDLRFVSNTISSAHAVAYRREGRLYLKDLNSKTGTFVNGRRVRESELRGGDEIRIGLTRIRFERNDALDDWNGSPAAGGSMSDAIGLAGVATADRQSSRQYGTAPTIEQLLGAAPSRITKWERLTQEM